MSNAFLRRSMPVAGRYRHARRGSRRTFRATIAAFASVLTVIGVIGGAPLAQATAGITVTSSAASVAPGSTIDLTASAPIAQPGSTTQQITQIIDPTKVQLTAVADITYPTGWALSYCSGSATDCTNSANFSATTPANAAAWAAVKAVRATGSVDSPTADPNGYQTARGTATGNGVSLAPGAISASGNGDGYQAFFDPGHTRVFNVFHHKNGGGQLDCHIITNGATCTGFPFNIGAFETSQQSAAVVVNNKIWVQGYRTNSPSYDLGFYCVDIAAVISSGSAPSLCSTSFVTLASGASAVGNAGRLYWFSQSTGGSVWGSTSDVRLWGLLAGNGNVTCLDTATAAPCTGMPAGGWDTLLDYGANGEGNSGIGGAIQAWDGKLYVKGTKSGYPTTAENRTPRVTCVTQANPAEQCTGWNGLLSFSTDAQKVGRFFQLPGVNGTVNGVCLGPDGNLSWPSSGNSRFALPTASGITCWDSSGASFAGPATLSTLLTSTWSQVQSWEYFFPITQGSRVVWANGVNYIGSEIPVVACWDAALSGPCTTPSPTPSNYDAAKGYFTGLKNYTAVPDPVSPNCLWVVQNDAPNIYLLNMIDGTSNCTSAAATGVTFSGSTIVPRMACTANPNAIRAWSSFTLTGVTGTGPPVYSATLTVKDSSGSNITGWVDRAITLNNAVDLSTLLPATTGVNPSFAVTFTTTTGTVSTATAQVVAVGDAPQLCTRVVAQVVCPVFTGPLDTSLLLSTTAAITGAGSSSDGSNTTNFTSGSASVTVTAPSATQCAGTLSGTASVGTNGSGTAVPGATVTLLDSSGNPMSYPGSWPADPSKAGQPITTTSAADGTYSFGSLAAASYKVRFSNAPSALVASSTVATGGSGTTTASGGLATSNTSAVSIGGASVVNGKYNLVTAATADTSTGGKGVTQTISPLTNDTASTGSSFSASGTAVKLCQPGTNPPCTLTSVTVTDEGTYTANANGTVTFVPLPNFTGTATPIPYTVTDLASSAASSTITATVVPAPESTADTGQAGWDTNQTFTPIANDTAGAVGGTTYPLSSTSVKICATSTADASCTTTSNIVVANEGTWSMNPATGVVTFDPLPSFTGTATPIKYCATDSVSQKVCSTITPTVNPPVAPSATAESKSVAPGGTVAFSTITGAAGAGGATAGQSLGGLATRDSSTAPQFVNASTCLITPGSSPATCDADGVVTVAGEGTYTLNTTTGVVSFTAVANVAPGSLTPMAYKVVDQVGNTATNTLTPVVPVPPTAVNDTSTGGWDSNQTISVLANDTVNATPPTVKLCSTAELAVTPPSAINCTQTTLNVANEGTYTVNGDGSVTFDPLPTFTGTVASPPTYQVADAAGQKSRAQITPTVAAPPAPNANPDTQVLAAVADGGTGSVSFDPLLGSGGLATGAGSPTVCLIDPDTSQCAGSNTVTIAGAGTYTLNPATKVVTFALAAGVSSAGSLSPVTYKVTDSFGQTATSTLTPIIPAPPTAAADTSSGYQGVAQVISILGNDSAASGGSLVPSGVKLCDPASNPPQTSPNCTATSVVIANQGTYSVNSNGSVTFTPLSNFTGTATPVSYQVADSAGLKASSTITPSVVALPAGAVLPTAVTDTKTGSFAQPLTFSFSANTGLTGTNSGNDGAGSAPSSSTSGNTTTSYSTPLLDAASVRLCSTGQVMPNCSATSLTTIDGTYAVNGDGSVTFTPASGFSGTATQPATYQISNTYNKTVATTTTTTVTADPSTSCLSPSCSYVTATDINSVAPGGSGYIPTWTISNVASTVTPLAYQASALLIPTISAPAGPSASNDSASTTAGTPVNISPWTNDTAGSYALRPGSILLCASGETAPACTQTTVTIAGQGTFSVDTSTGIVTFTPVSGFTGTATVPYRILDWNGSATNAVITVTVNAAPSSSGNSGTNDSSSISTTPTSPAAPATPTNPSAPSTPVTPAGPKLQPQRDTTIVDPGTPVVLDPLADATPTPGSTFKPSSVRIWDGNSWETTVTEPGVGTWTVIRGKVEFLPARGYTGTAIIRVRATDTAGARATSSLKVIVQPRNAAASIKRPATTKVPTAINAGVVTRASTCPSPTVGGKPTAWITLGGRTIPVKNIALAADGSLTPPASNLVAGLSTDHAALGAKVGTSVISWHVRYGSGCDGALNSLLTAPVGTTFTVKPRNGAPIEYRITEQLTVPKGTIERKWFSANGPHRLTLLTCNGLKNGEFTQTTFIGAEPVQQA